MAEREQKKKPAPPKQEETVEEAPAKTRERREDQGRARRPPRRDRRRARDQRRGLRAELHPEGRPVAAAAVGGPERRNRAASLRRCDPPDVHPGRRPRARLRRAASGAVNPPGPSPAGVDRRGAAITHGTTVVAIRYADGVRDGRRPPGHVGQPDQPPHHREGVPGRPLVRRGHRRRGRPGHGDGEALPAPARALREGRGRAPQPRGQGQPARPDGAQPPAGRDAGPRRRAAVRRLRHPPAGRPAVPVRRHRWALRGERLRRHRLRQPPRRHGREARLPRGPRPRRRSSTSRCRRCSRRPTRTPPPAAPTWSAASSRSWPPSPPRASSGCADDEIAERFQALIDQLRHAEGPIGGAAPTGISRRRRPSMSMPFYVAPEQVMKDRADYARKGIARGRSLVGVICADGHPRSSPRTRRTRCARSARSTTASPSPASASTTSSTSCASPASATPT